jgi:tetratricopeptide (TPR) repeat protein
MDSYFDLGRYTRPVTTGQPQVQIWFDRGLNWLYGFNHEEAVACFRKAAALDPECAMAHWGIAFASGPFYNMPWEMFSPPEAAECVATCHAATRQALACAHKATPVEQALIGALSAKFPKNHTVSAQEFRAWDDAYADAMRQVHAAHPQDLDVIALTAEAMMSRTPWQLWNRQTGEPAEGADTLEAMRVLEDGLRMIETRGLPPHPGMLHMYIHVVEMSDQPEKGLKAADQLRGLVPEAGHMEHMPGHIYMLCGLYDQVIEASARAIAADRKYLAYAGALNFYTTARCHDLHLMMYAGMMSGRFQPAIEAADEMIATLTPDLLRAKKPYMVVTLEVAAGTTSSPRRCRKTSSFTASPPPCTAMPEASPIRRWAISPKPRRSAASSTPPSRGCQQPTSISTTPRAPFWRSGPRCWMANWNTANAILISPMPICAAPSNWTTPWNTPSPGPGCTRPATRWARCCWSRATWPRPRRSTAPIWASMRPSAEAASTRTMSGRCTGWRSV